MWSLRQTKHEPFDQQFFSKFVLHDYHTDLEESNAHLHMKANHYARRTLNVSVVPHIYFYFTGMHFEKKNSLLMEDSGKMLNSSAAPNCNGLRHPPKVKKKKKSSDTAPLMHEKRTFKRDLYSMSGKV